MTSTTASQTEVAQSLLSELRSDARPLPTSAQLWRTGLVLGRIAVDRRASDKLLSPFRSFVDALPESYLRRYFHFYSKALQTLQAKRSGAKGLTDAIESLYGFLSTSTRSCELACTQQLIRRLASLHDYCRLQDLPVQLKQTVLGSLSFLLLDGFLYGAADADGFLERILELVRSIEEESVDCLGDIQEWQSQSEPLRRTLESSLQTVSAGQDSDQLDYLMQMLRGAQEAQLEADKQTSPAVAATAANGYARSTTAAKSTKTTTVSAADELERRIEQVQQILPDFGAGFVETALSLHQGDVERTITTLLGDRSSYPPTLQILDTKLPRRAKERSKDEAEAAKEARRLVKQRVALEEEQELKRYEAVLYVQRRSNEYDDDYDDQYDDMDDGGLGNLDNGYLDDGDITNRRRKDKNDEYEKIKAYNAYTKEAEADQAFWEENRNLNRSQKKSNGKKNNGGDDDNGDSDGDDGSDGNDGNIPGKKYRGPDKIRGGRILDENGRVVRTGRRNRKKGGNSNNSTNNDDGGSSSNTDDRQQQQDGGGRGGRGGRGSGRGRGGGGRGRGRGKSKPKSGNKVNNRRDTKQKKQGAFGVP